MDNELNDLLCEYKEACLIPTKPVGIKRLPSNYIKDEEKSVKWNREFVEANNKKYLETVSNLQRERSLAMNEVQKKIEKYIMDTADVSKKAAKYIFDFAYSDGHSGGIYEVGNRIDSLVELFLNCKD